MQNLNQTHQKCTNFSESEIQTPENQMIVYGYRFELTYQNYYTILVSSCGICALLNIIDSYLKKKDFLQQNNAFYCCFSAKLVSKHICIHLKRLWKKNAKLGYILQWVYYSFIFKYSVMFIKFVVKRRMIW